MVSEGCQYVILRMDAPSLESFLWACRPEILKAFALSPVTSGGYGGLEKPRSGSVGGEPSLTPGRDHENSPATCACGTGHGFCPAGLCPRESTGSQRTGPPAN